MPSGTFSPCVLMPVMDFCQIYDAGRRIQLCQQIVRQAGLPPPVYGALRVIHVAETDRAGRAGLLAGRPDGSVRNRLPFIFRPELRFVDPLYAEGTFFHDAPRPHGHLGVKNQFLFRRRDKLTEPNGNRFRTPVLAEVAEEVTQHGTAIGAGFQEVMSPGPGLGVVGQAHVQVRRQRLQPGQFGRPLVVRQSG